MGKIELRCEACGKRKGFKNFEQVKNKGWTIKHREHAYDIACCPKCS